MSPPPQQNTTAVAPRRWKHGAIPVLGLIGGIGSGKSRVAALLAARGAVVIDADRVGHEVLDQVDVREEVVRRFGPGVRQAEGMGAADDVRIDRRALGGIVFSDPAALRDLEALLHPRMEREFLRRIADSERDRHARLVVLDAAILLERDWDRFCDVVAFVDAPWDVRLARVASSRGWDAETLRAREAAQWPAESKRGRADRILRNDAGPAPLEHAVDEFLESLISPEAPVASKPGSSPSRPGPVPAASGAGH